MIELFAPDEGAAALKRMFSCFPSGVIAICALIDDEPVGLAASSFTSVSLDPPLVSFCVQNSSETWPRLRQSLKLGVSVLSEEHDDACIRLSRKTGDRFKDVSWDNTAEGSVFIAGAAAWFDCTVYGEIPAGDHGVVLLEIQGMTGDPATDPLVFHRSQFRRLVASTELSLNGG